MLVYGLGLFGSIVFGALLIGISLYDIREIRHARAYRLHPHARRYRQRPLVSVVIRGEPTEQCLQSLQHTSYRKLQVIASPSQKINGDLILTLPRAAILPKHAIRQAVIELSSRPNLSSLEVPVKIMSPTTLGELFGAYRDTMRSLFRKSRAGLGISPPSTAARLLTRTTSQETSAWQKVYTVSAAVAPLPALASGGLALYMLLVPGQAQPFMTLLAYLGLFMLLAIWWHDQLSFMQKVTYTILMPISIWYFLGVGVVNLLKILTNVSEAVFHSSIGLFVRVKDVLRIIE